MAAIAIWFAAGLLFGAGLLLSGMADPAKVLNFLDVAGRFDPSLAFVMGGAVLVAGLGYRLAFRRREPVAAPAFDLPAPAPVDRRLVAGAALFGVGWGLVGYCPGPALVGVGLGSWGAAVFVAAMLAGTALARLRPDGW